MTQTDMVLAPATDGVAHGAPLDLNFLATKAIEQGNAMEVIRELRLWDTQRLEREAKHQFDAAMKEFQRECPIIEKRKSVLNKDGRSVRYKYAPLDDILEQVAGFIDKHQFSYTFTTETIGNAIKSICTVKHSGGHCETSAFQVPIDPDAFMNAHQKFASALTYSKRYAFCNAFGILTGDEDTDGNIAKARPDAPTAFGAGDDRANKKRIVDLTRTVTGVEGYALTDDDKARIEQHLIDENFITPEETLATLTGARLADVVKKLEKKK